MTLPLSDLVTYLSIPQTQMDPSLTEHLPFSNCSTKTISDNKDQDKLVTCGLCGTCEVTKATLNVDILKH